MKVLFVTRHFGCLRNFERVIETLARSGNLVHLVALQADPLGGEEFVERLAATHSAVTCGRAPVRRKSGAAQLAVKLRLARDYLRYLNPTYRDTPRLRRRAWERTPQVLRWLLRVPGLRSRLGSWVLGAGLNRLEKAAPPVVEIRDFLEQQRPDVVLLTPLIGLGSPEVDYLLEAKALGLRTVFCVWSWDNLSSKTLIRAVPDAVTVWNETQKREAVALHGIPEHRIAVTGAQCFDHWFGRQPSRSRESFYDHVGLPESRPFVLYVCSALFQGSQVEAAFVLRWVEQIRQAPELRDLGVLIRPHPSRRTEWERVELENLEGVALWGANPIDQETQADYFDSLHYSTAVIGLNTSAFLEAGIVGRPTLTLLLPEFRENQEGTVHFQYLLNVAGGLLHVARDWSTHRAQLIDVATAFSDNDPKSRRFVDAFIRPHGRKVSATKVFVEAVDGLTRQASPPRPAAISALSPSRVCYQLIETLVSSGNNRRLFMDPPEAEKDRRREEKLRADRFRRETRLHERERAWVEKEQRRAHVTHERTKLEQEHRTRKESAKRARVKAKRRELARKHRRTLRILLAQRVKRFIGFAPPSG